MSKNFCCPLWMAISVVLNLVLKVDWVVCVMIFFQRFYLFVSLFVLLVVRVFFSFIAFWCFVVRIESNNNNFYLFFFLWPPLPSLSFASKSLTSLSHLGRFTCLHVKVAVDWLSETFFLKVYSLIFSFASQTDRQTLKLFLLVQLTSFHFLSFSKSHSFYLAALTPLKETQKLQGDIIKLGPIFWRPFMVQVTATSGT